MPLHSKKPLLIVTLQKSDVILHAITPLLFLCTEAGGLSRSWINPRPKLRPSLISAITRQCRAPTGDS
jgi:hypothetical protein